MPQAVMLHTTDPTQALLAEVGDISGIEIFNNQVLVAIYKRPEKTAGGIYLTQQSLDEDRFQGKVGLVLKLGPTAFVPTENDQWFRDIEVNENDWLLFRPSDGWPVTINKTDCRILDDINVRGRVAQPDLAW